MLSSLHLLLFLHLAVVAPALTRASSTRADFPNVLDARIPTGDFFVLSDLGAWHGVALPPTASGVAAVAAYVHGGAGLVARSLLQFVFPQAAEQGGAPHIGAEGRDAPRLSPSSSSSSFPSHPSSSNTPHSTATASGGVLLPGLLSSWAQQSFLNVSLDTFFITHRSSATRISMTNVDNATAHTAAWQLQGGLDLAVNASLAQSGHSLIWVLGAAANESSAPRLVVTFDPADQVIAKTLGKSYTAGQGTGASLQPGQTATSYVVVSYFFNAKEMEGEEGVVDQFFGDAGSAFAESEGRWEKYVAQVTPGTLSAQGAWLAVKAVVTLITNWRSAAGPFFHDGLYPSFSHYMGFWAWDSWKHARALAKFDPALGASQILALYDYLDAQPGAGFNSSMIPDVIRDAAGGGVNWCNTKPPLSAWAVQGVYLADKGAGQSFLASIFPRLLRYHQWWYIYRDHNQNGLAEFGSSQSSLQCMRWESGMDNAIRFDNSNMLLNSPNAYSADQESIDLNAFLYGEKMILAGMADVLDYPDVATQLRTEAAKLQGLLQNGFYNATTGFMHDRTLAGVQLTHSGCEGYPALWTGVPTPAQASSMAAVLRNNFIFNTYFPFPTYGRNEPKFDPTGYWRGPVWLDQAFFAIGGLLRANFTSQASDSLAKLLANGEGMALGSTGPFREYYNPLTGKGLGANHFGWSAAHVLLMVLGDFDAW